MQKGRIWAVVVLAVIFLAGCADTHYQYRHQENFYSPYGSSALMLAAMGDVTRDGTFEKGAIAVYPFDEGQIRTLVDEEETTENYPVFDPKCNNFKMMAKKTIKKIYRHQIIVRGHVVYTWNDNNPNWWAVGLTNLAGRLIDRGIDAAFLYTMPTGGDINIAGGNMSQQQGQKSSNVNKNLNKSVNKNPINIKNTATSGADAGAKITK
jgi:hypothetical protein